jgi:hypothetical protein
VEAMDRCGWEGDNHAATGQIALPAQLGQLSRGVNITSQSGQNHASASLIGPWNTLVSDSIGCRMAHPPWVISGEAGGAVTPRAGPTAYLRCTVPIARGKTDATGSSRAERHAHRAEGNGGRIVRGGLVRRPGGNFLPPLGKMVLAGGAACTPSSRQIQSFQREEREN